MEAEIREATTGDDPAVTAVALAAFGDREGPEIADLVTALADDPTAAPRLSLVAVADDEVVGHVLFTRARVLAEDRTLEAALLAPLAVLPAFQSRGIGGRLIREGLRRLAESDAAAVFVLGYPDYYGRFGFAPAGAVGLAAPYPIPPQHADAWMVQALRPGVLGRITGRVTCAAAIDDAKYWLA